MGVAVEEVSNPTALLVVRDGISFGVMNIDKETPQCMGWPPNLERPNPKAAQLKPTLCPGRPRCNQRGVWRLDMPEDMPHRRPWGTLGATAIPGALNERRAGGRALRAADAGHPPGKHCDE